MFYKEHNTVKNVHRNGHRRAVRILIEKELRPRPLASVAQASKLLFAVLYNVSIEHEK
jgi:hypothetical protein